VYVEGGKVSSIPDAIAQVLERHFGPGRAETGVATVSDKGEKAAPAVDICPSCAAAMEFDSGCYYCRSCGYSNC
jgi:ribonucleoside-diphosphate reductase alpha chain